jgi:hypothetical protein
MSKKKLDIEDAPTKISTAKRRLYGWNAKNGWGESKLWKAADSFLRSKVGHHWDSVYSEISEKHGDPDKDALRKFMKRQISKSFLVALNCEFDEEGNVVEKPFRRIYDTFFVHPTTKILCETPKRKRQRPKSTPRLVTFDSKEYAPDNNGVWYEVSLRELSNTSITYFRDIGAYDVLLELTISSSWDLRRAYGRNAYCYSKKQIGKRLKNRIMKYLEDNQ